MSIEEDDELPEGWATCSMGDIAEVVGGGTPKANEPGNFSTAGYAWVTPADLSDFSAVFISHGRRFLTEAGLRSCSARLLPEGTVLMSSRAPIGYVAVAANELCTNQGFKSFILRPGLDSQFVYYWIRFMRREIEAMGSGSTFLEVSGSKCKEIPLRFPCLAEQRRIVEAIERILAKVSSARERLERVPVTLKRFRQAVLAAACAGQLTAEWRDSNPATETGRDVIDRIAKLREEEPSKWRRFAGRSSNVISDELIVEDLDGSALPDSWTVSEVDNVASVCLGGTPSRKNPEYWSDEIPWVSSGEVANCRIRATAESISKQGLENSNAKIYPAGSVLIAMIGEGKTRGQSAILDINACTNQNVAGLVFDAGQMVPEYVWYWALGLYEKHRSGGRGGNYPALNGQIVRKFQIPVPPTAEQVEIVRRVSEFMTLADSIEQRAKSALQRVESLTQAVLAKAFRGELVTTEAELARREGRTYEPASELLARLKAASNGGPKRPRAKRAPKRSLPSSEGLLEFTEG